MAIRDEWNRTIADGDQLDDGYFNALTTMAPIGAVVAWLKTFTNTPALPDGWVECDGSVLSDATSVYNGQTLPDLQTGTPFLRGNSTSGGTDLTPTHSHSNTKSGGATGSGAVDVGNCECTLSYASCSSTQTMGESEAVVAEPPYYDIVWIMRIK